MKVFKYCVSFLQKKVFHLLQSSRAEHSEGNENNSQIFHVTVKMYRDCGSQSLHSKLLKKKKKDFLVKCVIQVIKITYIKFFKANVVLFLFVHCFILPKILVKAKVKDFSSYLKLQ